MVSHPSLSASNSLVLLCVLRMAREGVNEITASVLDLPALT